jgi:hypothetical protein
MLFRFSTSRGSVLGQCESRPVRIRRAAVTFSEVRVSPRKTRTQILRGSGFGGRRRESHATGRARSASARRVLVLCPIATCGNSMVRPHAKLGGLVVTGHRIVVEAVGCTLVPIPRVRFAFSAASTTPALRAIDWQPTRHRISFPRCHSALRVWFGWIAPFRVVPRALRLSRSGDAV